MLYNTEIIVSRQDHLRDKISPSIASVWCILIISFTPGYTTSAIDETMPESIPESIINDWKLQDNVGSDYSSAIQKIRDILPEMYADKIPDGASETAYLTACHWRRVGRMKPYADLLKKIVYARHHDIGGRVVGFTEDLPFDGSTGLGVTNPITSVSDDYIDGNEGGTALHLLEFEDYYPLPFDIITDNVGCLRDPCPTYSGDTIVFAWSTDNNGYHLFNIDLATGTIRQLTFDPADDIMVSDMEPCVTPSGDIIFCSSRCFQLVDNKTNVVSNLYICSREGNYLRRISYDQANVFYPTMVNDGTVMYTRWEFSDRNFHTSFGVFTMNPDGTRQNEFFGNQTSNPPIFNQARQIPGTGNEMKVLATVGQWAGEYNGNLCIIDAAQRRNGSDCVQYVAPKKTASHYTLNAKFQNPYPFDENCFMVSYRRTIGERFCIYFMNTDGERELLAWGGSQSVSQPVPLIKREKPFTPSYVTDYSQTTASVAVVNVYYGAQTNPNLKDSILAVPLGSVKKIRVIALEYRIYPQFGFAVGSNTQFTPVGRYMSSWNAKWIVGEAPVAEDGSAAFEVPPRTPVFLQLIDKDGICIQTMRSWMTLQPGERFDCFGCHEDKNQGMPAESKPPSQLQAQQLNPFFDVPQEPGSFHYPDVIQPVLDRNCVKSGCHDETHRSLKLNDGTVWTNTDCDEGHAEAYRIWNRSYWYLSAKKYVNWDVSMGSTEGIEPYTFGSANCALTKRILGESDHVKNITTFQPGDREKILAWIDLAVPHSGTYTDDMKPEHEQMYRDRLKLRETEEKIEEENIARFIAAGGYDGVAYGGTGVSDHGRGNTPETILSLKGDSRFFARFSTAARQLTIGLPSEGVVTVFDLAGRQVIKKIVGRREFPEKTTVHIAVSFPRGIYVVRFRGTAGAIERPLTLF